MIRLNDGHLVSTIAVVPHQEETEEEEIVDNSINEKLMHLDELVEETDEEQDEEILEDEE